MVENLIQNHGISTAISGMLVVFAGLILIAFTIQLFNRYFQKSQQKAEGKAAAEATPENEAPAPAPSENIFPSGLIPEEDLIAIAAAIECYRKIHFEVLQNKITFRKGDPQPTWKIGYRFGQRGAGRGNRP
jgi:Na+-transporting methylmalonyl-CoA/oxaloacetate decarboxylase gamma subunit